MGGGPGGGFGEVVEEVLPIALVKLCSCCAFCSASNSCWSRNPSYSETGLRLPSGSRLADLTGEGEWMWSDSTEPVLHVRGSSLGDDRVSLSADEDFGL